MQKLNKMFHLSLDDVGSILFSERKCGNPVLSNFINHTHERYHCSWGLNFFTSWDGGNIFDCDISELFNKSAAYVGCHAPNKDTKPYELSFKENQKWISDFYQAVKSYDVHLSRLVRFHYYSELYDCASLLNSVGVEGIFLTDRPAISYHLPEKEKKILKENRSLNFKGLNLHCTDLRLEWIKELNPSRKDLVNMFNLYSNRSTPLVIYEHEYEFQDPYLYEVTELVIDVLVNDLGFKCLKP